MYTNIVTILSILGLAQAHLHLDYPPTLLGDNNPFTPEGKADPYLNYPYGCCGQTVTALCKGHLDLLDQPEGQPVVTWAPGQKANFSVSGHRINSPQENPVGGTHAGGSAQIGISLDQGKTFKVIKTWQGNFPHHDKAESLDPADHTYDFVVPADLPAGKAVFAWTWINREQEFNMNCASRNLERSEALKAPHRRAEAVAFSARPEMSLNIDLPGSECKSPGNPAELRFPNPGPDVVEKDGNDGYELVEPTC
ncbi:uncharacterized protein EI97DRAFT_380860 [Westerdykella ornata]|uniref:Chitin-binding type-4 domain-containing protein n=1 Tax=Westerdykella ornata TaxID=318751 RepID=A0A6A6JES0_WESOR|nr:uncharacterized protein EI97DRAFT_380860 [Westerdykella ornata]KAF2274734.1 hypothetical protein EI97DRAFT_380860 [Westerdykella ornata]